MNEYHSELTIEKTALSDFKPLPEGNEQYPLEFIENNYVIKLRETDDLICTGICDSGDVTLIENLKNFHKKSIAFYEIERSELAGYLGERLSNIDQKNITALSESKDKLLLDKLANDAPIINLVNSIIIEAIRQNASDIHFECYSEEMVVRYRIDGYLHTANRLDKDKFQAIATRIKIMANLNIMERRLPQDGRITVHLLDDMVDLRVSIAPIAEGESIVLRLFNKKKAPLTLEQLGLDKDDIKLIEKISQFPNGLILVTGPTGSGKTTTLNAILQYIKSDTQKIITIEDPIEYVIEGVNQIQTNEAIGLSFDSLLRRVLRQDPNVIMVGEIRDTQTAELCIRAALTGHLVLSTLHTRDALSVIHRLKNIGIEPYLVAAVLRASVAQRLVRKICDDCKQETQPSKLGEEMLRQYGLSNGPFFTGRGCKACHNTGYHGRTGIFEILLSDDTIEDMIITGRKDSEIQSYLNAKEMKPIVLDGLNKVLRGITTISEVERFIAR